jgi:hypothetical protein
MADRPPTGWVTPRRVIVAFLVVVVVGALLSPATNPESAGRLTTFASDPGGTRGLFEVGRRLGWPVVRLVGRLVGPLDTNAVYVILAPPVELTSLEASAVLTAVRRGAGLLLVPGAASAIADSLGIKAVYSQLGPHEIVRRAAWDSLGVRPTVRWPFGVIEITDSGPSSFTTILQARRLRANLVADTQPIILGIPYERGRIVVLADGHVLANSELRDETTAVLPVRLLEWVTPGRRPTLVFTEYHQGYGRHPSVTRAIRTALFGTPSGRTVVQLLAAGAVLLLVFGIRPIAPRPRARVERRSPIEHVGALAHAYAQVRATRIATRRLVRGLRRRHPIGTLRATTDEEYLASLTARYPAVAPQVELLLAASIEARTPERFREAGAAVAHIERTLST